MQKIPKYKYCIGFRRGSKGTKHIRTQGINNNNNNNNNFVLII